VPLLIKVPWLSGLAGTVISNPVELIDIYPTAAALTHSGPVANASSLDGVDFSPLLHSVAADLDGINATAVAAAAPCSQRIRAFSEFPRCESGPLPGGPEPWPVAAFEKNYCKTASVEAILAMGYSLRSENMRYLIGSV
jgi:hypothetical protein